MCCRRRPAALRGRPGHPSVREFRQETEAAEFIAGLPRSRDSGDRIFRLERPAAECLPGSAARGSPECCRVAARIPLGGARPRQQPARRSQPAALRLRRVRVFGPGHERSGIYWGTAADLIDSPEETRAAGRVRRRLRMLTRSALPVMGETGCRKLAPNGATQFFRLVNARCGHASTVLTSNGGPRAPWGDPARRGDGRRARGPAVAPRSHRQTRQQLPDAASDGALEGRPAHGPEGRGRRRRPAERGIMESPGGRPEVYVFPWPLTGSPLGGQPEHRQGQGGMAEGLVREEARGSARRERGPRVWRDDGRATVCGNRHASGNPVGRSVPPSGANEPPGHAGGCGRGVRGAA